jgi:hypothetical protein
MIAGDSKIKECDKKDCQWGSEPVLHKEGDALSCCMQQDADR